MNKTANTMQHLNEELEHISSFEYNISLIIDNLGELDEDEISKCLIGIREMLSLRINKTFEVYTKALEEYCALSAHRKKAEAEAYRLKEELVGTSSFEDDTSTETLDIWENVWV